ncbi:hypothetical protein YN1_8190 [Nanoarchaeota archaeon]
MPSWKFHNKWANKFGIPYYISEEMNKFIDLGDSEVYNMFVESGMIDKGEKHDLKRIFRSKSVLESVINEIKMKYGENSILYIKAFVLHYLLDKIRDYTRDFLKNEVIQKLSNKEEISLDKLKIYFEDPNYFSILVNNVAENLIKWKFNHINIVNLSEDIYDKVMMNIQYIIQDLYLSKDVKLEDIYEASKKESQKIIEERNKILELIDEYNNIIYLAMRYSNASFLKPIRKEELEDNDNLKEKIKEIKKVLGLIARRYNSRIPQWLADRSRSLLYLIKW